jgi:hypothetical protein
MNSQRTVYTEAQLSGLVRDAASRRYLSTSGLPARSVLFRAEPSPYVVTADDPASSYMIVGRVPPQLLIGLNRDSGEVVAIDENAESRNRAWHVNADMEKFVASVEEFDARVPFYTGEFTNEKVEESAAALTTRLIEIDPTALSEEPGFWQGLTFDVALGDYSGDV